MGRMFLYFVGVVLGFAAASYLGIFLWGVFGPNRPDVFRYRLTLNVSYNGKIYSGSSVIEGRQYLFHGYSSSGLSGVMNGFSYKGTAPIVKLGEDGGWVFASVGAGSRIQWLPWFIYEGTVNKGPSGKRKIVRIRANPPRIEIPFSDDRAKYLYELFYVPPGPDGPKRATLINADGKVGDPNLTTITPDMLAEATGKDIKLVSFSLERTDAALVERIKDGPNWLRDLRKTDVPYRRPPGFKFTQRRLETIR